MRMCCAAEALAAPLDRTHRGARDGGALRGMALGDALAGASVRHPFLDRDSVVVRADYVELETGTGAVHTAPGHGTDDFETGAEVRAAGAQPGRRRGSLHRRCGPVRGAEHFRRADARSSTICARRGCWICGRIVRAFVSALLALQEPGDLPRDRAVVHRDGCERLAPRVSSASCPKSTWTPAWGEERMTPDDRESSGVVPLASAHVGYADSGAGVRCVRGIDARSAPWRASSPSASGATARRVVDRTASSIRAAGLRLPEVRAARRSRKR